MAARSWSSGAHPRQALVQSIFADKAVDGLRPARALMHLGQRYGKDRLEAACRRSLRYSRPKPRRARACSASSATTGISTTQKRRLAMDELVTLKPKLTRLKLSGVSETLETRIAQAMREKWSFSQFLEMLLSDEVERRDFKQLGRRLTRSSLEPAKRWRPSTSVSTPAFMSPPSVNLPPRPRTSMFP
jgi:hypothetical protein